jgi:hypothetical protein
MVKSNIHIDEFIEILASMGVSSEDVDSFFYLSQQFEMTEDIKEKMDNLESLINYLQSRYPDLHELLEEEICVITYKNFH